VSEATGLDAWFLHEKLILNLLSPDDSAELGRRIAATGSQPIAKLQRTDLFERALAKYLETTIVESLDIHVLRGTVATGQVVWLEQAIAFRGLSIALDSIAKGQDARASFSAKLATAPLLRIHGDYNPERVTCSTAKSQLSGTRRQFVLGYVRDVTDEVIDIRPIVIASRWAHPTPEIDNFYPSEPSRLWPGAVDQLAVVDFSQRLAASDLNALRVVPQVEITNAFSEILGDPGVYRDLDGRHSTLWTTEVQVENQPLRAAVLFSGPDELAPLTLGGLGRQGDQFDRLSETAADVLVLQHCHSVTPPVANMLRVYASDPHHQRRYLVIDGYETIKILRHFGYIT
jgi:hypothetical protein